MSQKNMIGEWHFAADTGILRQGNDIRRLENRASNLLQLLLSHNGKLVTHEVIIEKVWEGRFVSPNSVAVVISDIRRALDDDARNPTYIETFSKRGYRLIAQSNAVSIEKPQQENNTPPPTNLAKSNRKSMATIIGIAILIVAGILFLAPTFTTKTDNQLLVYVQPMNDQTKDAQYAALVPAVSELVNLELSRLDGLKLAPQQDARIVIRSKLIIWDGHPALSLNAMSVEDGHTFWSGMASGPETLLPRQVRIEIDKLGNQLAEDKL